MAETKSKAPGTGQATTKAPTAKAPGTGRATTKAPAAKASAATKGRATAKGQPKAPAARATAPAKAQPASSGKAVVKPGSKAASAEGSSWRPFEALRREVDRLFEEFDTDQWTAPFRRSPLSAEPFWRRELTWQASPAVDIVEKDQAYEVTAELPGLDENDVEVSVAGGGLMIRGHKSEEKEEKKKDYYLRERRFGSFERRFRLPDGVDADRIEASVRKGVLTVVLPKTAEAQRQAKKISVKST